ncbi:9188_t:CDS:1, partial [Paraglomus brasilianum]
EALSQGQSIYYLSIMIQQMFDLFAVKGRFGLPFGKFMFSNPRNFIGIFLGGCLAMSVVYIPPVNTALGSSYRLSPLYWLVPISGGVTMLLYVSARILILRRRHRSLISGEITDLQMMPTIYSEFEKKV